MIVAAQDDKEMRLPRKALIPSVTCSSYSQKLRDALILGHQKVDFDTSNQA